MLLLEAMRSGRARRLIFFASAGLLISANSHAKDGNPPPAESDHSVPLPPQPEPPPGVESNAAPLELESLPPPPAAPPGARKRHRSARPPNKARAPESASAATDDRDLPPSPEKDPRNGGKWYGAQTLAIDGTTLAMAAFGFGNEDPDLATVGVLGFLVASPIVHGLHGKGGRGWGSVGLRLAMPAGGAIIAGDSAAVGAFIGAMGASAIDALRAYDDPAPKQREASGPGVRLSPIVGRKVGGLTVGGSF